MEDNREMLLKRVQICDFILVETNEYLDTHPNDQAALDYFKKYNEMRRTAAKEFTEKYGPLNMWDFEGGNRWNWVDAVSYTHLDVYKRQTLTGIAVCFTVATGARLLGLA